MVIILMRPLKTERINNNETALDRAKKIGISESVVCSILNKKAWKHCYEE